MDYKVVVTPWAQTSIDLDLAFVRARTTDEVYQRWAAGLFEAIRSLERLPARCSVIPEQWAFDDEIRDHLYGRRQHKRRIIFRVEGKTVLVLEYRHGALPPLIGPEEMGLTGRGQLEAPGDDE